MPTGKSSLSFRTGLGAGVGHVLKCLVLVVCTKVLASEAQCCTLNAMNSTGIEDVGLSDVY